MQDCLKQSSCVVDSEDQLAKSGPVQCTGFGQYAVAKCFRDLLQCRLAWRNYLARDDVGVDDRNAERGKSVCDGRLAACDTAGQANSERVLGVQRFGSAMVVRKRYPGRRS